AHATYFESHGVDLATGLTYAMDLTPLIVQTDLQIASFVQDAIQRFAQDVTDRLNRVG
ncbi:MAG: hypothetical protein H6Q37_2663, partial [Chloroflexi bacterium]|nr:hypothetical protein [Chloroflexota bacterium]